MALLNLKHQQLAHQIGESNTLTISKNENFSNDQVYKMRIGEYEFIPEQKYIANRLVLNIYDQIEQAGHYDLMDYDGLHIATFGFNFARLESDLSVFNFNDNKDLLLKQNINVIDNPELDLTRYLKQTKKGTPLWKLCITFALIFLGLEILLIRFWKS